MFRGRRADRRYAPTNSYCGVVDLKPADPQAAAAVMQSWLPVLGGQVIPKIGERRYDHEEDRECD